MNRRDVFTELSAALAQAKAHSEGKLALKTHSVAGKQRISSGSESEKPDLKTKK